MRGESRGGLEVGRPINPAIQTEPTVGFAGSLTGLQAPDGGEKRRWPFLVHCTRPVSKGWNGRTSETPPVMITDCKRERGGARTERLQVDGMWRGRKGTKQARKKGKSWGARGENIWAARELLKLNKGQANRGPLAVDERGEGKILNRMDLLGLKRTLRKRVKKESSVRRKGSKLPQRAEAQGVRKGGEGKNWVCETKVGWSWTKPPDSRRAWASVPVDWKKTAYLQCGQGPLRKLIRVPKLGVHGT